MLAFPSNHYKDKFGVRKSTPKLNAYDTQRTRLLFYYEMDYTYDQIAEMEGCSKMAVKYSIDSARKKIIEKIKKFES